MATERKIVIKHRGEVVTCALTEHQATMDAMVARLGAWEPGVSNVSFVDKATSEFGEGRQVVDDAAKARIEGVQDAARTAGFAVGEEHQLYGTGTRMAQVGYDTQRDRSVEHGKKLSIKDACDQLAGIVRQEQRHDVELSAGELGKALSMNGALTFNGLKLREQAIRGLLGRLESTALRHVLGLRDRVADKRNSEEHRAQDKAQLLDVLQRECKRFESTTLKLRTRQGVKDVFAVVSPDYTPADAPEVLAQIQAELPGDARGTFSYDSTSTTWELRAHLWTPTPVDEMAVGEPFEGFSSFKSKDNGTGRLIGGGGMLILACLNAGVYQADGIDVSRVHRSRIMVDLHRMAAEAMKAIHTLCTAWGTARSTKIERPLVDGQLISLETAIPGFYRHMLTARKGELVGVLPGRTETHVKALAMAYDSERRDRGNIVRADLANGFTKYIQAQATPVRRDAEAAIAAWIVKSERVQYAAA